MDNRKAFNQKYIKIPSEYGEIENLEIEFAFKSTHVKTIDSSTICITTMTDIENYDSSHEASRYSRSEQLVSLGIICFFTHIPLTIYDMESGKSEVQFLNDTNLITEVSSKFIYEDENFTDDLNIILDNIENDVEVMVTILDRMRKGLYLEKMSNDANLHHDEIFQIYFGVIELLSDRFAKEFRGKLNKSMRSLLNNFYSDNLFYNESQNNEKIKKKFKLLNDVIISEELNLKNKIIYMCEELNIKHVFLENFVADLIKERNHVAHGRTIYNDKSIWPLPPFFSLIEDSSTKIDAVFYFMTHIIYNYFKLNFANDSQESLKRIILPSKEFVKTLLKEPENYNFTVDELNDGNQFNFTYETVFYLYVHKFTNEKIDKFVEILDDAFIDTIVNEDNGPILLNLSILFADSEKNIVREKAKENIRLIVKENWYYWSNIKDSLRYLKYYKVELQWFENWIINGEYKNL